MAAHFLCDIAKQPSAHKNLHFTSRFGTEHERGFRQRRQDPTPRKTAWHSDIKIEYSPHGVPHTAYNHVTPSLVFATTHPAPQRHPAFTPACFPPPSGTDSHKHTHKHTFHRRRAKPHSTATSQMDFGHTVCHTCHTQPRIHTATYLPPQRHAALTPANCHCDARRTGSCERAYPEPTIFALRYTSGHSTSRILREGSPLTNRIRVSRLGARQAGLPRL